MHGHYLKLFKFFFNLHEIFGVKDVYDFGKEKYGWVMQFFCA